MFGCGPFMVDLKMQRRLQAGKGTSISTQGSPFEVCRSVNQRFWYESGAFLLEECASAASCEGHPTAPLNSLVAQLTPRSELSADAKMISLEPKTSSFVALSMSTSVEVFSAANSPQATPDVNMSAPPSCRLRLEKRFGPHPDRLRRASRTPLPTRLAAATRFAPRVPSQRPNSCQTNGSVIGHRAWWEARAWQLGHSGWQGI